MMRTASQTLNQAVKSAIPAPGEVFIVTTRRSALVFFAAAALSMLFVRPSNADEPTFVPATTKVAVLPCIDATGEKVESRRKFQADTAHQNWEELFTERGFKLVDSAEIDKSLKDLDIDLNDEESYRRENFYKIAKALGADIIVFSMVIESTDDTKKSMFGGKELQGRARVKIWLLDARDQKAILSAVVNEGKAGGKSKMFATNEGTNRRANAVGNAIKEASEKFFEPYPVQKKDEPAKP